MPLKVRNTSVSMPKRGREKMPEMMVNEPMTMERMLMASMLSMPSLKKLGNRVMLPMMMRESPNMMKIMADVHSFRAVKKKESIVVMPKLTMDIMARVMPITLIPCFLCAKIDHHDFIR